MATRETRMKTVRGAPIKRLPNPDKPLTSDEHEKNVIRVLLAAHRGGLTKSALAAAFIATMGIIAPHEVVGVTFKKV